MDIEPKILEGAQAILESITDAFFALNKEWNFVYVNRQAEKILVRAPGELLGKNLWTEYPGLAGNELERIYRKVAAERVAESVTSFYPDHDRWYEVHVYPAPEGISVYFRNVTERVQGEHRLLESETRFRMMADSIPQIVWIADAEGNPEFFNHQWNAYTGVPFTTMTAFDVSLNFVHPDDHSATMDAWDAARREGRTYIIEHRLRSAAGTYRWFLVRAEPHRDPDTGKILRWFGTSTDVHDRKITEAALQKSEARYRTLFESIDEGFCVIEMIFNDEGKPCDYRFLEINPMFEQQTGLQNIVGKTMREIVPNHEARWFEVYGQVALTGKPVRFENEAKGLHRWYDLFAFRLEEESKRSVAVLFKDITERKRTEQELRLADRRKDEFLAMLAHELRNPLAPISAAADLLRIAQLDTAQVRHTSEIISRQVQHMTGLVDDLLDVSRVTRGLVSLDMVALDARHIVADAIEQVRPLIESRRHHLAVHMPPESTFVLGDQKRLVQVMANLLNNAAKYTPEGGNIALMVEVRGDEVMLAVADNGIGMEPALLGDVFELFTQAERTSDRSQGGLGLGLALVKSLIELHHGHVAAHSKGAGEGSEFRVFLPRMANPKESTVSIHAEQVLPASKNLRLLVVDDNADAASMLGMYLEAAGYEVFVENNSRRALERARIEKPHVCLLDIGLPDMDGNELARRLRLQPETAGSVLIAITGYGHEMDRNNAFAAGFDDHFVKPVDTARLASVLAQLGD